MISAIPAIEEYGPEYYYISVVVNTVISCKKYFGSLIEHDLRMSSFLKEKPLTVELIV
jgi:hypothetical protein